MPDQIYLVNPALVEILSYQVISSAAPETCGATLLFRLSLL